MSDHPHPQVQTMLETLAEQPLPPTHALSVGAARERLRALFEVSDPTPVAAVEELTIEGPAGPLDLRAYFPEGEGPHPVLVYFHGGGWVVGDLDTHDGVCRAVTNAADCAVISVEYRLAPEHPFPAGVEDAYAATRWVADYGDSIGVDGDRVAVGGDSAGGNLAAAVALLARDRDGPRLVHQSLIYPAVNMPWLQWFDSYDENAEGYLLEYESMEWYYEKYLPRAVDARNPYAAPLYARDLDDLPPATVVTAGFDPLRDEGIAYAERLRADGVAVEHVNYDDMIHGFVNRLEQIDRAHDAVETLADGLRGAFD